MMKIDTGLLVHDLSQMPALARSAGEMNFDGLWTFETAHEPFLPLLLAAEHSRRLTLGTSIAVAFAASPAVIVYLGRGLARFSKGRIIMGIGTQVKGHNERRFGVKWEKPVERMRDTILAIRAIWNCWQNQTRLNFHGEFFTLNLMTPFFNPGPHDYPHIPIYVAGVNRRMCRLAGELCDRLSRASASYAPLSSRGHFPEHPAWSNQGRPAAGRYSAVWQHLRNSHRQS